MIWKQRVSTNRFLEILELVLISLALEDPYGAITGQQGYHLKKMIKPWKIKTLQKMENLLFGAVYLLNYNWVKVFKNGPSKIF